MSEGFEVGDLVTFRNAARRGTVGVVSEAVPHEGFGHVLSLEGGVVVGSRVGIDDIAPAGDNDEGFAQLAYRLITLGSHVISKRLITSHQ